MKTGAEKKEHEMKLTLGMLGIVWALLAGGCTNEPITYGKADKNILCNKRLS